MKFATFITIAACFCVVLVFAATGANAKGGSPGFHSFLHQDGPRTRRASAASSPGCKDIVSSGPPACQVHHARYALLDALNAWSASAEAASIS